MKHFFTIAMCIASLTAAAQQNNIIKEKFHYGNVQQDTAAGYAGVVKVGNILYLSGITSAGDFATQVKNIYSRIENNLKKYGATFQNVVKENLYTLNIDSMKFYNYIRKPFYGGDFPAATWVQISRLYVPDRMLEVEVIAHLPEKQTAKTAIPFEKFTGTWSLINKKGELMGETWIKKDGSSIAGKSYMVKSADTTMLETVDLVKEGGDIFYIPVAYGQNDDKPVRFKLTSCTGSVYTFENPEHDFPKRIVYDFISNDELYAYIDDGTENKRQHYNYKRQK
jgi:2-iminobutanoate/2-iminopropanoate deaminase